MIWTFIHILDLIIFIKGIPKYELHLSGISFSGKFWNSCAWDILKLNVLEISKNSRKLAFVDTSFSISGFNHKPYLRILDMQNDLFYG